MIDEITVTSCQLLLFFNQSLKVASDDVTGTSNLENRFIFVS